MGTAAAIGIGLSIFSFGYQVVSNYDEQLRRQGALDDAAAGAESAILAAESTQEAALNTREATLDALDDYRNEAQTLRGSQKVSFAANGIKLNSRSAMDIDQETVSEANEQLRMMAQHGEAQFNSYFAETSKYYNQAQALWNPASSDAKKDLRSEGHRDPKSTGVYDWLKGPTDEYWKINAQDYFLI